MSDLRAVVFDLDDTLVNLSAAKQRAYAFVAEQGIDEAAFGAAERELWSLFGEGRVTREQIHRGRWEAAGVPFETALALNPVFEELVDDTELMPGALQALYDLREVGLKVAVLSNGTALPQRAKMARLGILPLLDSVLTSEEVGVGKPDARAFEGICRLLGVAPKTAAMVGDNLIADIQGAIDFGFARALWTPRPQIEGADLELARQQLARGAEEVGSLHDLAAALGFEQQLLGA